MTFCFSAVCAHDIFTGCELVFLEDILDLIFLPYVWFLKKKGKPYPLHNGSLVILNFILGTAIQIFIGLVVV